MENNSITIGIPFYFNTTPQEFILALDSILNQTIKVYEIHLIQDGNIDAELQNSVKNLFPGKILLEFSNEGYEG
ncbi:MAG: hypothetical protein CMG24_03775, partial [Candidatus Marinimicrobia bacterium]|nr:hypothetical protein [Candidatus Neomarinimicrobiota bacterium]